MTITHHHISVPRNLGSFVDCKWFSMFTRLIMSPNITVIMVKIGIGKMSQTKKLMISKMFVIERQSIPAQACANDKITSSHICAKKLRVLRRQCKMVQYVDKADYVTKHYCDHGNFNVLSKVWCHSQQMNVKLN